MKTERELARTEMRMRLIWERLKKKIASSKLRKQHETEHVTSAVRIKTLRLF